MNSLKSIVCGLLAMVFAVVACERRPLEVIVESRVRVKIVINWQVNFTEIYNEAPNGMTLMLWGVNTGTRVMESVNGSSVSVMLVPDTYHLLIFNDRVEEFQPYMSIYDAQSFENIAMRLSHYTRGNDALPYIYYPDPIGVAVDTFDITQDMVASDTSIFVPYHSDIEKELTDYHVSERVYEIPEVATPMTVTLYIKAKVKHRQSLKSIEASISGMAEGFYMSQIYRTRETGTIELDPNGWEFYTEGEESDSMGLIVNKTVTFGLPHGKELLAERNPEDNVLTFRITLANDSVQECVFNVGKDIRYLTPEGREAQIRYRQDLHDLKLELDLRDVIVMPPIDNPRTNAGFDAKVVEWEDGGTLNIGGF
ncbi:MAG: DUF5119 domain-containing protein [Bacteroidaceae bacterium]|nr:DUF5119 domain-containing protein [Bacteroidaceae bacterium]